MFSALQILFFRKSLATIKIVYEDKFNNISRPLFCESTMFVRNWRFNAVKNNWFLDLTGLEKEFDLTNGCNPEEELTTASSPVDDGSEFSADASIPDAFIHTGGSAIRADGRYISISLYLFALTLPLF